MSRRRQILFRCVGLLILATAPLQAQTDSTAAAQNLAPLERMAVLDISATPLTRNFAAALAKICRADSRFIVTAENTLTGYLKKRRSFSIFIPDSVQALCKNLALHHLLVSSAERAAAEKSTNNLWQITLRRLDGGTGQITKIFAGEYRGDLNTAESFPLRDMLAALLESPDIVMPVENALTEMPLTVAMPEMTASPVDSANAMHPANKRGRSWWWYVTGAALVSGGSAAMLLKNPAKNGATGKTILPDPPDPPN